MHSDGVHKSIVYAYVLPEMLRYACVVIILQLYVIAGVRRWEYLLSAVGWGTCCLPLRLWW